MKVDVRAALFDATGSIEVVCLHPRAIGSSRLPHVSARPKRIVEAPLPPSCHTENRVTHTSHVRAYFMDLPCRPSGYLPLCGPVYMAVRSCPPMPPSHFPQGAAYRALDDLGGRFINGTVRALDRCAAAADLGGGRGCSFGGVPVFLLFVCGP